jgi:hypothetical protein
LTLPRVSTPPARIPRPGGLLLFDDLPHGSAKLAFPFAKF